MCTGGSCFVTDKGRDLKKARASRALEVLAEAVGFEPTVPFGTTVFKTASLSHSDTPPLIRRSPRLVQVADDDPQDTTLPQRLGESPALPLCAAIVCVRVNSRERARAIGPLSRTWRDFPISTSETPHRMHFAVSQASELAFLRPKPTRFREKAGHGVEIEKSRHFFAPALESLLGNAQALRHVRH